MCRSETHSEIREKEVNLGCSEKRNEKHEKEQYEHGFKGETEWDMKEKMIGNWTGMKKYSEHWKRKLWTEGDLLKIMRHRMKNMKESEKGKKKKR